MTANCITEDMDLETQLGLAETLSPKELFISATGYNWGMFPEKTLLAIARRPDCSLLTALAIFYMGEPGYDETVPVEKSGRREILAMLKFIHDRINAGGYQHRPEDHDLRLFNQPKELFLAPRSREDGKPTLWQLDPNIVRPALLTPAQKDADHAELVMRQAEQHNKALQSTDGFTRDFNSKFEELFPDAPAVKAAKEMRENPDNKKPLLKRLFDRGKK